MNPRNVVILSPRHWKTCLPTFQRRIISPNMNCKVKPQTTDLHLKKIELIKDWLIANLHQSLVDKHGFILIFSCLRMKLFESFRGTYNFKYFLETIASRISLKLSLQIPWNICNYFFPGNKKSCWQPGLSSWIQATMLKNINMGYLILAGLLENRTAKSTKAFNPKKEANLLLSFAVSTKRKMRIDA